LNKKAIILLFIANAISGMAQGISMIAIPWYFAQRDMLGYFGACYLITNIIALFWVPLCGSIIDRYDRKHVFMGATIIGGSIIAIITSLGFYWGELPALLVGTAFLFTFLNYNIHYPNLYAFVQEITPRDKYSKMTSLLEIIGQMTTIMGGAIATLLLEGTVNGKLKLFGMSTHIGIEIEPLLIHEIFLIDSLTYFVAFLIISMIVYKPLVERKKETGTLINRLKIGWAYLMDQKPILWYGILSYMVFVAMLMEAFYLGVSYVSNHLQESGDVYANSKMAYAAGAIMTGITLKYLFSRLSIPAITILFAFASAGIFFTQYASHSVGLLFCMLFLLGITNAGTRIARITYLFRNVPNALFGRIGSVLFLANILFRIILLSIFAIPFFQISNNIIYAYLIISGMLLLTGLLLLKHYKSFDLSRSA